MVASGFTSAASIEVTWDTPTTRKDGSSLDVSEIKGYYIYYQKDNVLQTPVFVEGPINIYTLPDITKGEYLLWMSSVDSSDQEGDTGQIIQLGIVDKEKAKIESFDISIKVIMSDGEELEVRK